VNAGLQFIIAPKGDCLRIFKISKNLKGNPMKPSKLYEALHALIGERVPLHIWGACGVGKSQIVHQVANDLDYDFLDVRAVQLDPVDLRGLPRISADQTEWVPPKFLPTSGKGILFLDELTSAPQMTQAGCYQLVLDRKLGEYVLPDGWVVIAAGNPASERGVHFAMPRPLRNRFVHLDLEPDLDDWCRWAVKAQVRPEIIAFLRFKPELLHTADATSDANAWPTPRSWEMASQVLCGIARRQKTQFLSGASEFEAQLLDGTVGPAAASELVAFIRLFRQLPSIDEILLNPTTAPLPTEPSAQIAIATALGRAMSDTSVGRGIAYRESLMRGTEDLWKRLREVVAHMVDRLNEPESRFHGSLVTNVLDLVDSVMFGAAGSPFMDGTSTFGQSGDGLAFAAAC
jgi:MoxR-like ATPase